MSKTLRKNLALTLVILFGVLIGYMLLAFLEPIGIALILAFLLYPLYDRIYSKTKNKVFSASLIIVLILVVIIIPLFTVAGVMLNNVNHISINQQQITEIENSLTPILGDHIPVKSGITYIETKIKTSFSSFLDTIITQTSSFLISTFIMFFVLYYLLVDKKLFLDTFISLLPFSKKNSKYLISESKKVVKAILIGQILTAIIQGLLGMFSFYVAGISNAFFWGIIMIILSIIPVVGAFLVWIPAGIFLIIDGNVGMGIFVLLWGAIVVSQIDNIIRPKLIGRFADIHPLETFIGIFMGLSFFGMIGIIIGPLIISLFSTLLKVYNLEYSKSDD